MSVELRQASASGKSFKNDPKTVYFSSPVASAGAALTYFRASYGDDEDHDVHNVGGWADEVDVEAEAVSLDLNGKMQDQSDNKASASITVSVIAEVS